MLKYVFLLLISPAAFADVTVLMYHDINNDPADEYSVTPAQFKADMDYIKSTGLKVIPITEINEVESGVVITFDDGYKSILQFMPLLKEYGFPITINIVPSWITAGFIDDIKPRDVLSWSDVKILHETKLVTIGSHTYTHRNTKRLSYRELNAEFKAFNMKLMENVGIKTTVLAWPYGLFDDKAIDAAEANGYRFYQTSIPGKFKGNTYRIERFVVNKKLRASTYLLEVIK